MFATLSNTPGSWKTNELRIFSLGLVSEQITMNLTELRDLQSRLMLIAGEAEKGRQDVNRFIDVLSAVEKLTKTYIKLKRSGCLLFTNWKAKIK